MLVALFFSVNPIGPALESIRSLPADRFGRWLDATPKRALLPRLDRERAIDRYVNGELSTYRYWASNRIALAALADELRINFLSNLLSITVGPLRTDIRSEEHTSELQSLMRISYAVFCLKKKTKI